jgi:hypothetical protein
VWTTLLYPQTISTTRSRPGKTVRGFSCRSAGDIPAHTNRIGIWPCFPLVGEVAPGSRWGQEGEHGTY